MGFHKLLHFYHQQPKYVEVNVVLTGTLTWLLWHHIFCIFLKKPYVDAVYITTNALYFRAHQIINTFFGNLWEFSDSIPGVGGDKDEGSGQTKEEQQEQERLRQEAIKETERERRKKYKQQEEEREEIRQTIRDKVRTHVRIEKRVVLKIFH